MPVPRPGQLRRADPASVLAEPPPAALLTEGRTAVLCNLPLGWLCPPLPVTPSRDGRPPRERAALGSAPHASGCVPPLLFVAVGLRKASPQLATHLH